MIEEEHKAQLRVGIFMVIGLTVIALMVVYFGRLGDGLRKYYTLRVEYPNASGLLKGASVLLAGAKIGMVENSPTILPNMDGVYVNLKIYDGTKIPSLSDFTIGSSGLLGDRFVQIILKKDAVKSPPLKPGATIKGLGESGIGDIMEQAPAIMADIQKAVKNINGIAEKLNTQVFKDTSVQDLNTTLSNLKTTSASFADASKKMTSVVQKAESAIKTEQATLLSAKGAADEIQKTMADIHSLVRQAKQGRGTLGLLLADQKMAANLKALVANMRRYGILWYEDQKEF